MNIGSQTEAGGRAYGPCRRERLKVNGQGKIRAQHKLELIFNLSFLTCFNESLRQVTFSMTLAHLLSFVYKKGTIAVMLHRLRATLTLRVPPS